MAKNIFSVGGHPSVTGTRDRSPYNKYHNKKVEYNGIKFDSLTERDFYIYLSDRKMRGEVTEIEVHKKFVLQEKFEQHGEKYRAITYEADFFVTYNTGKQESFDVKGDIMTEEFKLKAKLYRKIYGEEIPLKVVSFKKKEWVDLEKYKKMKLKEKRQKK